MILIDILGEKRGGAVLSDLKCQSWNIDTRP